MSEWVSEWELFYGKWASFQLHVYHDEKKLDFDDMIMISVLWYTTNTLSWICVVLSQLKQSTGTQLKQSTGTHVAPFGNILIPSHSIVVIIP